MFLNASEQCKFECFPALSQMRAALLEQTLENSNFFNCFFNTENPAVLREDKKYRFLVCCVQALMKEHNFHFQKVLTSEFA